MFVATWLGGFWLIVGSALRPLLPGGWLAVGFGVVLGWVPILMLVRGLSGGIYPGARIRLFVLRPFWYAMLFLPMLAGAVTLGAAIGLPLAASGSASRWALAGASMLLLSATLVGYSGSRRLVVKPLAVTLPRLPPAFDGLRIVQISDLHVGPQTPRRFLERVKQSVMEAEPDLIVITGDQVDDFWQDVELFVAAFGDLRAPFGVFAIPGNHDIYAGWSGVHRGLVAGGIQVLVNDAVTLERDGQRLWLAGTGDPAARGFPRDGAAGAAPDIERTLRDVPADEPVLALAHNPVLWPELVRRGVDLTLSGHTHYGQFAIPGLRWSLASPFLSLAMGSYRSGDCQLYINPGTNYWGIPLRIGTPPEVTVLTLSRF
jgi:predicted MPP superfamily phosphohydrolase